MKGSHDRPLAAHPFISYRARGPYGWIMIGATDEADAWRQAERSTPEPHNLQVWNGQAYEDVPD